MPSKRKRQVARSFGPRRSQSSFVLNDRRPGAIKKGEVVTTSPFSQPRSYLLARINLAGSHLPVFLGVLNRHLGALFGILKALGLAADQDRLFIVLGFDLDVFLALGYHRRFHFHLLSRNVGGCQRQS